VSLAAAPSPPPPPDNRGVREIFVCLLSLALDAASAAARQWFKGCGVMSKDVQSFGLRAHALSGFLGRRLANEKTMSASRRFDF